MRSIKIANIELYPRLNEYTRFSCRISGLFRFVCLMVLGLGIRDKGNATLQSILNSVNDVFRLELHCLRFLYTLDICMLYMELLALTKHNHYNDIFGLIGHQITYVFN